MFVYGLKQLSSFSTAGFVHNLNHSQCACAAVKDMLTFSARLVWTYDVATVPHHCSPQVVRACVVMDIPLPVHLQLLIYVLVSASVYMHVL